MDLDRLQKGRIIRDGVVEELAVWLESLLDRVDQVETELRGEQQIKRTEAAHHLELFHEKKRELQAIENTIEIILRRHGRADLDMLIHFANELREELLSLSRDLGELLGSQEEGTSS